MAAGDEYGGEEHAVETPLLNWKGEDWWAYKIFPLSLEEGNEFFCKNPFF